MWSLRSQWIASVLLATACSTPTTPAPTPTPVLVGALNPAVTQATVKTTVCRSGWTATIRPSLPTRSGYEHDHIIPLSLGGAPMDPGNLWFEPLDAARKADVVESRLHREMCAGKLSLNEAQREIVEWKRAHG